MATRARYPSRYRSGGSSNPADIAPQQEMLKRRLPVVIVVLVAMSGLLLVAVARYQLLSPDVEREIVLRGQANTQSVKRLPAQRGLIYDRDGYPLAFNRLEYSIGISPNLALGREREIATQLGVILNMDEFTLYQRIINTNQPWFLVARPVSAELGQQITELDDVAIVIDPLTDRFYPQGMLAAPVIGVVIEDEDGLKRGAFGVEGRYNERLSGRIINQEVSNIPFDLPIEEQEGRRGVDLILTIDRDIQFWVETELQRAITESNATGGTIIVMDPRNGDILAMASLPTFDPNDFLNAPDGVLTNPAISQIYEPGSIFKVLTVAAALEKGAITPDWTYNDQGVLEVGGRRIYNWDDQAYGVVDTTELLVKSLNIGASEVALALGPDDFYAMMRTFGIGRLTQIDLPGEEAGLLKIKGIDPQWSESDLATNSYGQGVSVTPLQMVAAVAAIANDGLIYQPHVVRQVIDGDRVEDWQPSTRRAISRETADIVTNMMVQAIEDDLGAPLAQVEGYSVAGKSGTANIPSALGYEVGDNSTITSFIGFLPADDPQLVMLVKLDRPDGYWASRVAAPVFSRLAERLVLLLGIPDDATRQALAQSGGLIN